MRPAGLAEVEPAKADGRWEAAYERQRSITVPEGPQRVLIALLACVAAAVPASAASAATPWTRCSKAAGNTAAGQAGLPRALDADPVLRRIFGTTRPPSAVYKTPRTSLCGDFDGD